jgi:hypothetical protein
LGGSMSGAFCVIADTVVINTMNPKVERCIFKTPMEQQDPSLRPAAMHGLSKKICPLSKRDESPLLPAAHCVSLHGKIEKRGIP